MRPPSPLRVSGHGRGHSTRSLDFLQAIEKTLGFLLDNAAVLRTLAAGADKELRKLQELQPAGALDPEGRVCQLLEQCLALLERLHDTNKLKCEHARADGRLRGDDGVVEAYEDYLAAIDEHHHLLFDLREWIRTHDALLEQPSGRTCRDVGEMFRAMGVAVE